jgi:predicted cupin superfamily sugar epimerase
MTTARQWIDRLGLTPHPEGGHFHQTYRSAEAIAAAALPPRFGGDRAFSTAIYYLLEGDDFSAFHRIKQDEVWHFYDGAALTLHVLAADGSCRTVRLGRDLGAGELPQAVVPAGDLFAAAVSAPHSYALVGCTVAPGFDFADFELPGRQELCRLYPQHRELIERFTRPP